MNSFFKQTKLKKSSLALLLFISSLSLLFSSCKITNTALAAFAENTYAQAETLGKNHEISKLRAISFNTKICDEGRKVLEIASEIKKQDPDLVFLQEIDKDVKRSGKQDILKQLSEFLEMNYAFFPAIDLGGGTYGLGILSRFKINNAESFQLESGQEETRILAKANIKLGDKALDIFNCHLSFESTELRIDQLNFINNELAQSECFILGGDFNVKNFEEYNIIHNCDYVNSPENQFISFNQCKNGDFGCIDNIIFSKNITLLDSWMADSAISDHNLIAADFELISTEEIMNVSHETLSNADANHQ